MQSMAHGWDSYFHNLPPVSSDPRTLTRTLESEALENFIDRHDFIDTVVSSEGPAANSNLNTNYCSNSNIGNSGADCVFQNYCRETPRQADGEQVEKHYSPSCGNGDIPNFTTDGLSTSISFPSSFATDFQGLKQDSELLATPILEDYSDVSSCSDADVGDTRPSCKFMASNPVPKFKTDVGHKHHSLEWLFSPTGDTFPIESLCPKISASNANLPRPSNMKAIGSQGVADQNHCNICPDQKQEKVVERDFLQGKDSDILISGHENVTDNRIVHCPEEEEQVTATTSTNVSTCYKEKEEYSDLNSTDCQDRITGLYKQDKFEVLKMEKTESDSFDEQNTGIPNCSNRGDENLQTDSQEKEEIMSNTSQSSNTQSTKLSHSKDCSHDDESCWHLNEHQLNENKAQDSVCSSPTLINDCHLIDTSGKKEQHFACHAETCLQSHSSNTDDDMHPENHLTNAANNRNTPFPQDSNHSCSDDTRTSLTIATVDKNVQNVAHPPESNVQMDKSSGDLNPCLENECTDPTERKYTTTTTDPKSSDPAVSSESSISESSLDPKILQKKCMSAEKNTNASSASDQQQSLDQGPLILPPQSLTGDTDKHGNAPSSPDKQQSADESQLAKQPQSLSGDADENTRESFKETDTPTEEQSVLGRLYGEPLSREDSSVTGETTLDTGECNEISVGTHDRNTMDYSGQTPQLTSSAQLRKRLQPVVLLDPLDSVNGMSNLYFCGICQYKTDNVDGLIEHKIVSHFVHSFQFCKTCNIYLLRNEQSDEHLCVVTKKSPQLSSDTSLKRKRRGKHKCDRCKITFKKLVQYISHMRIHSGITPFKCSGCGLYFSQSCSLRRHKRVPGRCKSTNKEVTKSDVVTSKLETPPQNNMVQKKKNANLSECYINLVDIFKAKTCSLCDEHFSTVNQAQKHYFNLHMGKNLKASSNQVNCEPIHKVGDGRTAETYNCPFCPRVFKYSFNRTRHLRDCVRDLIIGGKGKVGKAYCCPLCHTSFTTTSNRAKHVRTVCFRRYLNQLSTENAKSRQNAEQKKKNAEQETQSKETEQQMQLGESEQKIRATPNEQNKRATPALIAPQNFPQYKCNLCPAVFYYSSGKSRHMKKHELFKLTGKMFKYRNTLFSVMSKPQTIRSAKTDESKGNVKLADENGKLSLSCRFCGKNVSSQQSLKKHERNHRGERPYPCLECKKRFKKHRHLMAHKNVHKRRIQCTICKKILPTIGELIQHRASHGKKGMLQCPDCPLQFEFPVYLQRHVEVHKNRENKEPLEKEQPSSSPPQSLESLKQPNVLNQLQCSLCKDIFEEAHELRKHCLAHITGSSSNQCPFCKHKFSHRRYLVRHMIIHTGDKSFSCTNCGKQFFRHFYLKLHREKCLPAQTQNVKTERLYECSYCPRSFSKKDRLINHHLGHKTKTLLMCSRCGQYYGVRKLNQHQRDCGVPSEIKASNLKQRISHSNLSAHKKPLQSNANKVLQLKCPHCTQRFRFKSLLLRHLVSHTGVQPYACVHCGHRYSSQSLCFQHAALCDGVNKQGPSNGKSDAEANLPSMPPLSEAAQKQTEGKAELYKCKFCTKTFTKPRYLRSHILTHNEVKPYRCKACDSCFSRHDHLKVHQTHCNGKRRQRLEIRIPKITLNDVGKGWQNKFAIESAEKQPTFDCEDCSRSFPTQATLSRHVTMCHITKRLKCERCGGSFAHEKSLKKHKKSKKCRKVSIETKASLPLETNPPSEKVMEPLDVVRNRIVDRIKPCSNKKHKYVCGYCPRTFNDSRTLVMHIRLHTGEKPHACEHCGERFIRKDYVLRHLAKCTKREQQVTVLCDRCGGFFFKANLEDHKMKCSVKPSVTEAKDCQSQQSAPQSSPKGFSCAYCSSRFLLFSQLQEHFVNAHKLETMVTPLSTGSLQHHLSNIPNIKEEPLDETCDEQLSHSVNLTCKLDTALETQLVCPDCNMTFSNKAGLVGHMRVHSKDQAYHCKICNKGFWNRKLFRNHYRKCKLGQTEERSTNLPLESPLKAQIDFALDNSVLVFHEGSAATDSGVLQTNSFCKDDPEEQLPQHSEVNKVPSKYQCSECDKSFTDGLLLISHLEDHGREEQQKKHNTCSKCGRVCLSQSGLEKHMKFHGISQKFPCPDCSKMFYVLSDLEVHRTSHDKNRPYICRLCNQRFWTRPSLHNHYREEHPSVAFACPFCSKSFSVKKSLTRHLKKCHPKEHKDLARTLKQKSGIEQQSSSQVSTADESDDGGKNSEDSDSDSAPYFPCHVCSKTFPTSESLEDHQRCHLGEKPFECEECGRCFFQASQLQQHQRMHKSEFKCQACGRGFVTLFALRTHKHTHGKSRPYRCSKCDFSFTGPSQLAEHMTTHREENFPCDVCNQVFLSKTSRAEHRKSHSKSDDCPTSSYSRVINEKSPSSESSSVFSKELKYRCGVCNRRFKDPEDLSEHGCMEAKERSYSCLDCDTHFLHASHLKKHRNTHHPSWSSTEYPCNLCNSSFASPQYFLSHLKTHINPTVVEGKNRQPLQDYICPVCHLCFTSVSELIGHFPTHLASTTEFECTECSQTFLGSEAFRQHHCSRQQHEKTESKYSAKASPSPYYEEAGDEEEVDVTGEDLHNCPSCTMQFSSKSSLLEHQNKQHLNNKPFQCGTCGKTFALRRYLRRHELRHQTVVMQSDENCLKCTQCDSKFDTPRELSLHAKLHTETEVGQYRCDMCYKSFSQWALLKRHQESHVGEVVYECTECDKAFAFPHLLEEHQQTHAGSSL
ncbi:zinc finger Xfin-like [Solea senegalensis]|uniref:Zinc finger Xfin-like n=1 Tax=Solea senegalensis TaxID=28829 RepID=A0AAV6PTR2_SOLSE|nr:zinc finger protein 1035 [Solea senegalensis]KAG7476122.1 zinc finger Xfin-like [Solea senegalensis]